VPNQRPLRIAAIDIGTNSVRLLVAERGGRGDLRPLVRLGESCRLGEGLETTGRIGPRERPVAPKERPDRGVRA